MFPSTSEGAFVRSFVRFVRQFGLLDAEQTPCGAPLPVAEAHALTVLAEAGPLSQTHLGRQLHLPKSNTSRLVDSLVQRGWAERTPDRDDSRIRLVTLTEAGRELAATVHERRTARLTRLLSGVPEEDRATVVRGLEILEKNSHDL